MWSGAEPKCRGVYCGDPGPPGNATRTNSTFRHPEVIVTTCNPGYRGTPASGNRQIMCLSDGSWNSLPMQCERVMCPDTEVGVNTDISIVSSFYRFGDQKTYTCMRGHRLVRGNLNRVCQADGTFSEQEPVCQPVSCGDPGSGTNATRNATTFTFSSVVIYQCLAGHETTSGRTQVTITCNEYGNWSGTPPSCAAVHCGPPDAAANANMSMITGEHFGSVAVFTCNLGHVLQNGKTSLTLTCHADKTWTGGNPNCIKKSCGDAGRGENATKTLSSNLYEDIIYYQCRVGHEYNNQSIIERKCQANGKWSGTPPRCRRSSCGEPPPVGNATRIGSRFLYEDKISYHCKAGYRWRRGSGPLNRTCQSNKRWSDAPPACERISCGHPGDYPTNQMVGSSYKFGDIVRFTCAKGYETINQSEWSNMECLSNGTWLGAPPLCSRVFCGDPGYGNNSLRNVSGFHFEDRVKYRCLDGFWIPHKPKELICMANRNWSSPAPDCEEFPVFEVDVAKLPTDPPDDAPGANTIGSIGLGLALSVVGFVVLSDLVTIAKDIKHMKKNIKIGIQRYKQYKERRREEARVKAKCESLNDSVT